MTSVVCGDCGHVEERDLFGYGGPNCSACGGSLEAKPEHPPPLPHERELPHRVTDAALMDLTLPEARRFFFDSLREGAVCPCCERFGKVYRRKLNSGMALTVVKMFRHARDSSGWLHMVSEGNFGLPSRDYGTLQHWGLTESSSDAKEDGNPDAGYWRLTENGKAFARNEVSVPKYVYLYNDKPIACDEPEAALRTTIVEALGGRFKYDELMGA